MSRVSNYYQIGYAADFILLGDSQYMAYADMREV